VDLLCWMQKGATVLRSLASQLGDGTAREYEALAEELAGAVVQLHWNEEAQAFHDFGKHDNHGEFRKMVVVRCVNSQGQGVDAMVDQQSAEPQKQCPRSHPEFKFPLGDGAGGLMTREKYITRAEKGRFVEHMGYVSLFPLMLRVLPVDSDQLRSVLASMRDPKELWTPWGLRSLSKQSPYFQRGNAPGDAPYWRGPIWINLQWLALSGLHHYATSAGPHTEQAREVYTELRDNVIKNLHKNWQHTNFLWEQYSDKTGAGQRARPFNGWSSLVVSIIAEDF